MCSLVLFVCSLTWDRMTKSPWVDTTRPPSPRTSIRKGSCTSPLLPCSSRFKWSHQTQPLLLCVYSGRLWQTSTVFGLHYLLDTASERKAAIYFALLLTEPRSIRLALPAELNTDGKTCRGGQCEPGELTNTPLMWGEGFSFSADRNQVFCRHQLHASVYTSMPLQ